MPAREPTYYRWAEDKPCTTNQTYGYELRNRDGQNGCVRCNACKICAAEASAAAASAATKKTSAELQQHRAVSGGGGRRDTSAACRHSEKVQCKPINRGYTMGHIPITKRLQAASSGGGRRRQRTAGGTGTSIDHELQTGGKDLCLWHALSGTVVYCKSDEQSDE